MVGQYFRGRLDVDLLFFMQLFFAIFFLLSIFINYKIKIDDHDLTYQILFLKLSIYKNVVHPQQIKQIKFILVGWTGKGAVIKTKKGFNIHIGHYFSNEVIKALENFAKNHNISIYKTKDYLIIEK